MLSSISENRAASFAYPLQGIAGGKSGSQTSESRQPDGGIDLLTQDRLTLDQREKHIQQLIRHSMDDELLQQDRQRSAGNEAQAAMVRGLQKQVSAYTIVQVQQELLGFPPTQTLGYA